MRCVLALPRSYPLEAWGEPCAVRTSGPLEVPGEIRLLGGERIAGRFHGDSGAGSFLNLNSEFVRSHGVTERVSGTYPRTGSLILAGLGSR